jgi:hypothetical protein
LSRPFSTRTPSPSMQKGPREMQDMTTPSLFPSIDGTRSGKRNLEGNGRGADVVDRTFLDHIIEKGSSPFVLRLPLRGGVPASTSEETKKKSNEVGEDILGSDSRNTHQTFNKVFSSNH